MKTLRILPVSVVLLAGAVAPSASHGQLLLKKCSAKKLSFEREDGSVTLGVAVRKLHAYNETSCKEAKQVATVVAKRILADKGVSRKAKGYRVKVDEPCAGCSPSYGVSARKDADHFLTFVVRGGA